MAATPSPTESPAKALSLAAYASFFPIGIATVLLGPMLPALSARWSLNYSQAGALFTAQYLGSTSAVVFSGWLVHKRGYRFAIKSGLLLATAGLALLLSGPEIVGIVCIAAYGAGLGLAVPAANILVAEVNPHRRSASLNILNFCWSAGAVSCPFLAAFAVNRHRVSLFFELVAALMLLVLVGILLMPASVTEPRTKQAGTESAGIQWKHKAIIPLAALFFVYVGTENAFGGWVATFAKSLGSMSTAMSLMTPSFFYSSLMIGRWVAPFLLRRIDEVWLARGGLILSCAGMGGMIVSHSLSSVLISASVAGFGTASVYPITIALLSREFGPAASQVGSLMFTLSNIGGGLLPWSSGIVSTRLGTLKAGLAVPLIGSALMFFLYVHDWKKDEPEDRAAGDQMRANLAETRASRITR